MARTAKVSGQTITVLKESKNVEIHITRSVNEDGTPGDDLTVTPKVYGKFLNASAYTIDSTVVEAIKTLATI